MVEKIPGAFTGENRISDEEENEDIYNFGLKRAQEIAREQGLEIGQTVAHPNGRIAYTLKKVVDDVAFVWVPGQEDTIKKFLLNDLFDPNVAKREAMREAVTRESKKHPQITN